MIAWASGDVTSLFHLRAAQRLAYPYSSMVTAGTLSLPIDLGCLGLRPHVLPCPALNISALVFNISTHGAFTQTPQTQNPKLEPLELNQKLENWSRADTYNLTI